MRSTEKGVGVSLFLIQSWRGKGKYVGRIDAIFREESTTKSRTLSHIALSLVHSMCFSFLSTISFDPVISFTSNFCILKKCFNIDQSDEIDSQNLLNAIILICSRLFSENISAFLMVEVLIRRSIRQIHTSCLHSCQSFILFPHSYLH